MRLYRKYIRLLPESRKCKKLYRKCKKVLKPNMRFCDQPFGINKIKATVKEVCKNAGTEGKISNHSPRAMCISRMYANDIPKQIIKGVTGHRSDCVRIYKCTNDELRERASHTLGPKKVTGIKKVKKQPKSEVKIKESREGELSVEQMENNIRKTKLEWRRKKFQNAKARLSLKRFRMSKNVTIDVNLNIKK